MRSQQEEFSEQQRIRVTNIGRLQDFEDKLNKMIAEQNADSVANSMKLQSEVKALCYLECIGKSNVISAEVQSCAQQRLESNCRHARAYRKDSMSGRVRPAVVLLPAKQQGAPRKKAQVLHSLRDAQARYT